MKFKLGETGVIIKGLAAVIFDQNRAEGTAPRRLPAKVSYWLDRFLGRLQEEFQKEYPIFEKARIVLCEGHAKKDEKGKPILLHGKGCQKCGAWYKEDAKIKDEATGKMIPQTACLVCGTLLESSERFDIPDMPAFNKELAELQQGVEIELPWNQIPLEMLGDTAFSGEEMMILGHFIEEPEGMKIEKPEKKETK